MLKKRAMRNGRRRSAAAMPLMPPFREPKNIAGCAVGRRRRDARAYYTEGLRLGRADLQGYAAERGKVQMPEAVAGLDGEGDLSILAIE